mmetsp:Transcript_25552/g.25346  ORF Transcript_25552/g.25346 Transcript_25552/m.25346 type:complete len:115 (-) Transcript_25552:73-417(-)
MSGKEKRVKKVRIESTQLPPTLPHGNIGRLNGRTKSNVYNMAGLPSQIRSRRASKLKISLKSPVNRDSKVRHSTPQSFLSDSKNYTKLSEKTRNVFLGKRSTSKHSRRKSKTKL